MNVVIFGNRDMSQLAHWYLTNDSDYKVVAFCLDGKYIEENNFCGLPVVPFEEIEKNYPPEDYKFFAPLYASEMNKLRENVCNKIKSKGYSFINYIHSSATISNAKIGTNCFFFENVNIQPFCDIGDNNIIWSLTHVGHHSKIASNIFVASLCNIAGHVNINNYCFIGCGATIRDGINIASSTFLGQSCSVVENIDKSGGVYLGVPAKRVKEITEIKI